MKKREIINISRALLRALQGLPEKDREAAITPFLAELKRMHKLPESHAFLRSLEHVWSDLFGPREISLVTAHRVPAAMKEKIAEALPSAEVHAVIDPRLIGGAIVRMDDRILDSSVIGTLERMKKSLMGV